MAESMSWNVSASNSVSYANHTSSTVGLKLSGTVAAKFEYTAYSKLAADKISNMGIFEFAYVY